MRKQHLLALTIAVLFLAAFAYALRGNVNAPAAPAQPTARPVANPVSYNVTYRVMGTAKSAMVTYQAAGGTEQKTVSLPWSTTFQSARGAFLYISAQNQGATGSVRAIISMDGRTLKDATSEGAYVIASASTTAQ